MAHALAVESALIEALGHRDMENLFGQNNKATDGTTSVEAEYLEVVAKLKISKSGVSGILVLGWLDHTRHLESPVSWFPATSGKWARIRNATKFRQFSFLRITDEKGQSIAHFPEPPYIILQKFTDHTSYGDVKQLT